MEPAVDPYHPLLRMLERYRQDVHYLRPPGVEAQLQLVQQHLGRAVPGSLRAFLLRWNGATLFRGALRIRSIADLAPAAPDVPSVILFADGPRDDDRWGFASTGEAWHFGRWDGHRLVPLHEHFQRWLLGQARVLDEDVRDELAQLQVRLEVDPQNGLLEFQRGERLLAAGDGDGALKAYRRAAALNPEHCGAWQRVGEALLSVDPPAARHALLMALRHSRMPLAYPGAPCAEPGVVRSLEAAFPPGDAGWERELFELTHHRATDLNSAEATALYEAAGQALARVHLGRGERPEARETVQRLLHRAAAFPTAADLPQLTLTLVHLDIDLGHHDEAEEGLRRLRRHSDPQVRARGELALARVALLREEPWAEEIARGVWPLLSDPADRCDCALLLAERRDASMLDEAVRIATRVGDLGRLARAELLLGDAARDRGDLPAACQHYLACEADPEVRWRAQVRLGDLQDDPADAHPHYVAAVAGYKELHLPLREAWARLRLVRCGDPSQADQALRIFKEAGLAAGVAACDALLGRPGQNLSWHLGLASELARQRHDAQRRRPPLTRADADRPERRLLAHRRAIASCDVRIVEALAEDLRAELKKIRASEGRARDPAVMRFVAAVDLLAGHPSFDAARVLMELLREDIPQAVAQRALIGAVARSGNMPLVEALLEALDADTEPRTLARVVEILGWRREEEAIGRLRALAAEGSVPLRRAAITALGRIGDFEACELLLPALDVPELAEAASIALLLLGEWRGVDFHGQALAQGVTGLSVSSGEFVGRFGGPSYLLLLLSVADREDASAAGALQGLGLLGSVRAVPRLIELAGNRDPQRQQLALAALEVITGQATDPEEPQPRARWESWWADNLHRFDEGTRYREGRPFGVRRLIDKLADDDEQVRLTAYDELVISTGARLPFDADGPWRMQLAHRAAWDRWWADHAHELGTSGWLFFGRSVG